MNATARLRHLLAVALVLLTASIAFAQSPSTPATQVDEVAAAVPNPGGWCEGKSDDGRGSNWPGALARWPRPRRGRSLKPVTVTPET